jgi:flagella basal body P-ring formation protein FlgA
MPLGQIPLAILAAMLGCLAALPALGEGVLAARTLRARTVILPADIVRDPSAAAGLPGAAEVVGRETRVTIFEGTPIRAEDIAAPALIERNQIVALHYRSGTLDIVTEARALARAGAGETIRVMNLASRRTVQGIVRDDGSVGVLGAP